MLKVRKIRYSDRGGYSVEWHDPDAITLSYHHAKIALVILLTELSNEAFEQEFDAEERTIIRRYAELHQKAFGEQGAYVDTFKNPQSLQRALHDRLTLFYKHVVEDPIVFQKEYLGWSEPTPDELVNQQFRYWLKRNGINAAHFERMIASMGMPGQLAMKQLEKRFGSFNPETGKFARSWSSNVH